MSRDIALTFDVEHPDQPESDPLAVERILDHLARADVRGTFFIQGAWASAYPDLARRIADGGHLLGLHSHWHAAYTALNDEGIRTDLEKCRAAILSATGRDPAPWFRLPFGRGAWDDDLLSKLNELGFTSVYWNVDPRDWDPEGTVEAVAEGVAEGVRFSDAGPAVVVFHAWSPRTAGAIPDIVGPLSPRNRFVTIDELSRDQIADIPRHKGYTRRTSLASQASSS